MNSEIHSYIYIPIEPRPSPSKVARSAHLLTGDVATAAQRCRMPGAWPCCTRPHIGGNERVRALPWRHPLRAVRHFMGMT